MRKSLLAATLCAAILALGASHLPSAQAVTYTTIVIDGACNYNTDWNENDDVFSANGGRSMLVTWDAANIFFGWEGADAGGTDRRIVAFDLNPGVDDAASVTYASATFGSRGQPDYVAEYNAGTLVFGVRSGSTFSTTTNPAGMAAAFSATGCAGNPFVEMRIPRSFFGAQLPPSGSVALYGYFADSGGASVFGGMPSDAGLCNPSTNESTLFNCALYFPDTSSGRIPKDDHRIQADLTGKTFTAMAGEKFHDVILDGGTLECPTDGTINIARNFDYTSGTFTLNGCTVNFNGNGALGGSAPSGATFQHVSIASGKTLVANTGFTLLGNWRNDGTFTAAGGNAKFAGVTGITGAGFSTFFDVTVQNGGTLTMPAASNLNLRVKHDWLNNGTFIPGAGTVTFNGTTSQTISGTVPLVFNHLTLSSSAGVTVSGTPTLTVGGALVVSSGSFTPPPVLLLKGDFTNGGTLEPLNGTLYFAGGVTQNMALNAPTTFYNLFVAAGTTLAETAPADNATVAGTLTNQGILRKTRNVALGANTFGLTGAALNLAMAGTLASVQVDRIDANHPSATLPLQTGRYWVMTSNGGASGYVLALTLPHVLGGTYPTVQLCRDAGSHWDCDVTSASAATVTRDGVTQLSAWTVGDNPPADAGLSVATTPAQVSIGQLISYTPVIVNAGTSAVFGTQLTNTVPAGLSIGSAAATQGTCLIGSGVVTCAIGDIHLGGAVTATITVRAPDVAGTITNTAEISAANDPGGLNNQVSTTVGVWGYLYLPTIMR